MRVLFIGDVVGGPGRRGLKAAMPELRDRHSPDLVIVNGENSAGGIGITEKTADGLFDAGADILTTGNHVYRHREAYEFLDRTDRVIRPANYPHANPGRGFLVTEAGGMRVGVVNISGGVGLTVARSPFHEVDSILERIEADCVVVDFHAEVTSEKVAMGWHLDGRVAALFGTHTHVPTADARVLPGGTAYITDVGMTGARGGVIGVRREQSIAVMRTHMPQRYDAADEDPWLNAVLVRADGRRAEAIESVLRPGSGP
jgi:2',3'-cyclic-nucleotide 2'-phosphodiesterase